MARNFNNFAPAILVNMSALRKRSHDEGYYQQLNNISSVLSYGSTKKKSKTQNQGFFEIERIISKRRQNGVTMVIYVICIRNFT